ncbi:uncharacterized protein LOC135837480 isoform X2 [Planococcus citri]
MKTANKMATSSTSVDIDIKVAEIYTLLVTNTLDRFDDKLTMYDVHKAEINNCKKIPVVITYYSPENSNVIRAVSLQYPVMFIFRIQNTNAFETFSLDKLRTLKTAYSYMNLVRKLPVVTEFSLMEIMAELHNQPLGQLWKKSATELQSLRALHESLVREKANGGISQNYVNMERELQETLANIHDVDWVSEIPKLKQKFIWQGEIMHHEYVIKVLKNAMDSIPDASVKVDHAVDHLTSMQTKYENSLTDFFAKFEGTARKRVLVKPSVSKDLDVSKDIDDIWFDFLAKFEGTARKRVLVKPSVSKVLDDISSSKLQLKYAEAISKPYPWGDFSSTDIISPPIFSKDGTPQERYDLLVGRFGTSKMREIKYENKTYRVAIDSRLNVWNCRTDRKPEQLMNPYDKTSLRNYIRNPTTVKPPPSLSTGAFLIPFKYGLLMSYVCRRPLCGKVWRGRSKRDEHEKIIEEVVRNEPTSKQNHYSHASVLHDRKVLELGVVLPPRADTDHAPGFYDFDNITDEANIDSEDESNDNPSKKLKIR